MNFLKAQLLKISRQTCIAFGDGNSDLIHWAIQQQALSELVAVLQICNTMFHSTGSCDSFFYKERNDVE